MGVEKDISRQGHQEEGDIGESHSLSAVKGSPQEARSTEWDAYVIMFLKSPVKIGRGTAKGSRKD